MRLTDIKKLKAEITALSFKVEDIDIKIKNGKEHIIIEPRRNSDVRNTV